MSNRLESLTPKKNNGAKPSLKFKPKIVERKSKEERDKTVKVKEEYSPNSRSLNRSSRGNSNGLRGNKSRGGRNNYAGTHVLSSGLLSSGTAAPGPAKPVAAPQERFHEQTSSPTPSFIQTLKLRSESTPASELDEDDEGDDVTKINMNQEYRFADEDTMLFPVRPTRNEPRAANISYTVKEETPEIKQEPGIKVEETELQQILNLKADLESKISQPVDILDQEESQKLNNDHNDILETITRKFADFSPHLGQDKFTLFQLPKLLPNYDVSQTPTQTSTQTNTFASNVTNVSGRIGSLNVHKSGKITINLGNDINLDVTTGAPAHFLQELVVLDMKNDDMDIDEVKVKKEDRDEQEEEEEVKGVINKLGEVDGKFIGTPVI